MHIPHFCPISQKQRARHGNTHGKRYHGSLQWKCGGTCDNGGGVLGGLGWAARVAVVGRIGGRRGRKRTCPRCSNAAGLNTHAGTPRHAIIGHASIAPAAPGNLFASLRTTCRADQACDQEGGIHLASASRLRGNAAVKCSDAAVRQRTEDTERGARLETHLARLRTSSKLLSRSTRTRRFTNVHLWRYYKVLS